MHGCTGCVACRAMCHKQPVAHGANGRTDEDVPPSLKLRGTGHEREHEDDFHRGLDMEGWR